jgi:hypothetical protein
VLRPVRSLVCSLFVLLCTFASVPAQAQITTSRVNVLVTGKRCSELKDVYLVVNGDDLEDRWLKLEPAGSCRWTADLGDGSISTSVAGFSLRGDFARSDCQRAAANEEELTANLEFACCNQGPVRNVRVKVDPPMPVSYVRDVRPFAGARIRSIKCLETATFNDGQAAIGHAQFSGENVYLRLGPVDRKQQTLGLLINDVVADDGTVVLTRDGVVYRLMVQRAKGKDRSAPTLSSNAISLDIKRLGALKLARAEIEVIK